MEASKENAGVSMASLHALVRGLSAVSESGLSFRDLKPSQSANTRAQKPWITRVREGRWGQRDRAVRSSRAYLVLIVLVTLCAVFADDVRLAALPKSADGAVAILFFACFGVFVVDIALSAVFDRRYMRSVVFLLDIVATASILLPVLAVDFGGQDSRGLALARLARVVRLLRVLRTSRFAAVSSTVALSEGDKQRRKASTNHNHNHQQQQQQGNGSQRGSHPRDGGGRGIVKLKVPPESGGGAKEGAPSPWSVRRGSLLGASSFRATPAQAQRVRNASARPSVATSIGSNNSSWSEGPPSVNGPEEERGDPELPPGHIGPALVNATTSNIILLVLILAVGLNLLEFAVPDRSPLNGLRLLHEAFPQFDEHLCFAAPRNTSRENCAVTACCASWDGAVGEYVGTLSGLNQALHVKFLQVRGIVFQDLPRDSLRDSSVLKETVGQGSRVEVDISGLRAVLAVWSIAQTLLFMALLLVFPYVFGRDVLSLVITPLEIIFDRVGRISVNPFGVVEVGSMGESDTLEIDLISESLNRLTKLLQIGLGEAGSKIIRHNLQSGTFSALQAGSRTQGMFGFFDIRSFTDCCEVLGEDCVEFVNSIAGVIAFHLSNTPGAVNKNIGDAFLVAWKPVTTASVLSPRDVPITPQQCAESALRACRGIVVDIGRMDSIQQYAQRLRPRLGDQFCVKVGCGLHFGWAIEGAVGSELKIDATYLSHHVAVSELLESLTKRYAVPMLMSQHFYRHLAKVTQAQCRLVDRVWAPSLAADLRHQRPPGSLHVRTDSAQTSHELMLEEGEGEGEGEDSEGEGEGGDGKGNNGGEAEEEAEVLELWTFELLPMRQERAEDSHEYMGLYVSGDWGEAREALERFQAKWPEDIASREVCQFMEQRGFEAPKDWKGRRCDL